MLVKDITSARWIVNTISQQGFHFDSLNFPDKFNMALYHMAYMGHIGQNRHAR